MYTGQVRQDTIIQYLNGFIHISNGCFVMRYHWVTKGNVEKENDLQCNAMNGIFQSKSDLLKVNWKHLYFFIFLPLQVTG